jgi:para-aminobenzoate synthetase/4-amino-4-deoxychorismate lyase
MTHILLHDAARGGWLEFEHSLETIVARRLDEVLPALQAVEEAVERHGQWTAGFVSYEAAPACDPALETHAPGEFPLVWFGVYPEPVLRKEISRAAPPFHLGEWTPSQTHFAYAQSIAAIKGHITRGDTYQVNHTLRLRADFDGDPRALFAELVRAQPTEYAAYIETDEFAICSASPELFFRLDGAHIESRPMKGTAARGRTLVEDEAQSAWLHGSEKNRAENVMIVDMVRNDLGRIARVGSVRVPQLFHTERYPSVWQMTSTVTAQTDASFVEIFQALFPCASITGAPKPRTMRIIRNLEAGPRQVYTGAIGYFAPGRQAQFNVAIRTVLVDRRNHAAEYGVGGGIVWDSTAENEYDEIQIKARILMDKTPPFSLFESILWTPSEGYSLLDRHLRRMADSAVYFAYPFRVDQARETLDRLGRGLDPQHHKVRLVLAGDGTFSGDAIPLARIPKSNPARLKLALEPVRSDDLFLYHKTTHRITYTTARSGCADCDEIILWNERGEVTETTNANLAFELDGEWVTPPVSSGLLPGTYRAEMLERGELREKIIRVEDLPRCTKILVINSVRPPRTGLLVA